MTIKINMQTIQSLGADERYRGTVKQLAIVFGRLYSLVAQREQYIIRTQTGFISLEDVLIVPEELDQKVLMAKNVAITSLKHLEKKAYDLNLPPILPGIWSMQYNEIIANILAYVQELVSYSEYGEMMNAG